MQRLLISCLFIASGSARASGFYFGDNGTKAMVQGGAFTAQARTFLDTVPNARLEKPFEIQRLRALINERIQALG